MFTLPVELQQRVRCDQTTLSARISPGLYKNLGDEEQQLSFVQEESGILKMILHALEINSFLCYKRINDQIIGYYYYFLDVICNPSVHGAVNQSNRI